MSEDIDDISQVAARQGLLSRLTAELGMPLVAIVSAWRGDQRVNFGEESLRAFFAVLDAQLQAWQAQHAEPASQVGVFLVGRGGFPAFADGVVRAVRERGLSMTALVPSQVDGALSLVALGAEQRLLHPYGALGAYDRPALGRVRWELNAEIMRHLGGLTAPVVAPEADGAPNPWNPRALLDLGGRAWQAHLAAASLHRMLAAHSHHEERSNGDAELTVRIERALSTRFLGHDLALSASEIDALGLATRCLQAEPAEIAWELFELYERGLGILEPPAPRYTASEVADEVEFALATDIVGAIIEGSHRRLVFELDTGRPDPDTSMLLGQWRWERDFFEK